MRTYSTPESALNQEITKLAIIETVVAVALYIGIAIHFGTFRYLAMAVVAAPLMLFRTEASAEWGFEAYRKFDEYGDSMFMEGGLRSLFGALLVGIAPLVGHMIRIGSTVYWTIRGPLHTFKEMPRNWLRQSFCTDFMYPPEIVPLEATKSDSPRYVTFMRIIQAWRRRPSGFQGFRLSIILLVGLILFYLPPVIYRVSFKATAVAYAPFVWVAHATLRNPLSVKARLERITKGELEKVRRYYSIFVVTVLAAKIGLVYGLIDRDWIAAKFPSKTLMEGLVVPDGWPWWQMTLAADALLTFGLFLFADAALARVDTEKVWNEEAVLTTLSAASFLRAVLSIATMSHFFYIALMAVAPESLRRLLS